MSGMKTDLYQLTMAQGYFLNGRHEQEANFNLFFRKCPFKGNYAIVAGLRRAIDYLQKFGFSKKDIDFLSNEKGQDGEPLFKQEFLKYLKKLKFTCDVDAVIEGTVVFPREPLIRIRGPIIQCQLVETALLQIVNFHTLIATKASRIVRAAKPNKVVEFGFRRAQNPLEATDAAYLGGCSGTSNTEAGLERGIPIKGTHAHSWIMSFPTELESFEAYAKAMPNNCIFLVDTYDTIQGVKNAITVGKSLRAKGYPFIGVRLDSGDLAELSKVAREMLDDAGFESTKIVASNDLDEYRIKELMEQGAKIDVYGIGTKLVTAYDQPALGGVYKLSAIKEDDKWEYKIKFSADKIKQTLPGILGLMRLTKEGKFFKDVIYDITNQNEEVVMLDGKLQAVHDSDNYTVSYLLQRIFDKGHLRYYSPSLKEIRARVFSQLDMMSEEIRNPFSEKEVDAVVLEHNYKNIFYNVRMKYQIGEEQ